MKPTDELSDDELLSLVIKWKEEPAQYTSILINQIYPTLCKITKSKLENFKRNQEFEVTASSIVNEVFFKINNGAKNNSLDTLREFYSLLGQIILSLLVDRQRKCLSQKRRREVFYGSDVLSDVVPGGFDINLLSDSLEKLKKLEPEIAEVLSLKFYSARNNEQIAYIMNESISSTERKIKNGKLMMNALVKGVELRTH